MMEMSLGFVPKDRILEWCGTVRWMWKERATLDRAK
jgi:hypothetical protein